MKRDFLRGLGIEDKEIIDKILDENSSDIGKAKGDFEALKTQVDDLTGQLKDRDKQLADLKDTVKDNETLTAKITELEEANKKTVTDWQGKLTTLEKNHAIEGAIRDAKGKNTKAIMALLDVEKITFADGKLEGLSEQLETLTKGEDTGFLFGETKVPAPKGTDPHNPPAPGGGNPPSGNSFADAVAKAFANK